MSFLESTIPVRRLAGALGFGVRRLVALDFRQAYIPRVILENQQPENPAILEKESGNKLPHSK
jgi:hypothetical protein